MSTGLIPSSDSREGSIFLSFLASEGRLLAFLGSWLLPQITPISCFCHHIFFFFLFFCSQISLFPSLRNTWEDPSCLALEYFGGAVSSVYHRDISFCVAVTWPSNSAWHGLVQFNLFPPLLNWGYTQHPLHRVIVLIWSGSVCKIFSNLGPQKFSPA